MSAAEGAVRAIADVGRARRASARERIAHATAGRWSNQEVDELAPALVRAGRITLNFHPDRPTMLGVTVAEGLRRRGRYVSQFVTGASNGSRSAVGGGERAGWEQRLFADAYGDDASADERPVYGSLDLLLDPHGGSPRFGSCFVVLRPHVVSRTTFCVGDSHTGPIDVGTADEPLALIAGLVEQAVDGRLLGRSLGVDSLCDAVAGRLPSHPPDRELDGYVEAQVHGGVELRSDVERIVLDPSFVGTDVEDHLRASADELGFELAWHAGSTLAVDAVPSDFRGPTMPSLARRAAGDRSQLDAAAIGRLAAASPLAPPSIPGDPPESDLQQLKYLWHVLLRFGRDATAYSAEIAAG